MQRFSLRHTDIPMSGTLNTVFTNGARKDMKWKSNSDSYSPGLNHRKQQRALKLLEEGKVSFLKAAEMAGLSVWDFSDIVRDKGMVWVKSGKFIRSDIENSCPE